LDIVHWIKNTGGDDDVMYEYWFARIRGISVNKKMSLREYFGDGKAIFNIEERRVKEVRFLTEKEQMVWLQAKKERDIESKYLELEEKKINFIPIYEKIYPEKLRSIMSPPYALYVKGELPDNNKKTIAIVGARRCTPYGEAIALEYGEILAGHNVQIISGMARGIDGAGQRGALNKKGKTFAVLGCGVDICYPGEHQGLYQDIQINGGVLSEYFPGTPPLAAHFPARNRIISGLADAILVIEAKEKSGSLITADMALEQGKDVYALPGPVTSSLSKGCHYLISQGAGILISPSDLLKELRIEEAQLEQKSDKNKKELETPENIVYSCLGLYPKGLERLVNETMLSPKQIMRDLVSLELEGKVKEISKNQYVRRR